MQRKLTSRKKNTAKLRRDVRVKTHEPARGLPETMRDGAIDAFGGPDALSLHSLPVPVPAADEVLIATHTAGVETWDAEVLGGWSPTGRRLRFPYVLGTEGSGTIAAIGARIRRFAVGGRIYAGSYPKMGFYAEYFAGPS